MKRKLLSSVSLVLLFSSHAALSDEIGLGRDRDIPDAPPSDPAPTETTENPWQELLEWLDTDVEQ